jgi:hypothetical protein
MRALDAERGVIAVARVDPGLVGEAAEELRLHVIEQRREASGVFLRVADAAGEQGLNLALPVYQGRAVVSPPPVSSPLTSANDQGSSQGIVLPGNSG